MGVFLSNISVSLYCELNTLKYPLVLFPAGTVRERVGNGRQYIIEWADQSVQLQVQKIIRLLYCYA